LKLFLSDISIQKTKQKEVLDATVSAAFAPTTKEFLHLLVDAGRYFI
jgi:F0F1-type ATP synthase delta subunit